MSDNRFDGYPTKRRPNLKPENETPETQITKEEKEAELEDFLQGYPQDTRPQGQPSPPRRTTRPDNKRRTRNDRYDEPEEKKSKIALLYIAVLVVAVAACLILFVFAVQWFMEQAPSFTLPSTQNGPNTTADNNGDDDTQNNATVISNRETNLITAMVIDIQSAAQRLTLLNTDTRQSTSLPLYPDAIITNRTGGAMTFSQLRVGHLVDISYDANELEIVTIRENVRAWERRSQTNVHVNFNNNTISVGHGIHDAFEFNSDTLVLDRGVSSAINQINPTDSITIHGIGTTAWLIQLDASHGFLQFTNMDNIIDGVITIGNMDPLTVAEAQGQINVAEGIHRVVVSGANIDPFVENVVIERGEVTIMNLSEVEPRSASLYIVVAPQDARVFINDILAPTSPTIVDFGEHTIRVERDGYIPQSQVINIINPMHSVHFNLEEYIPYVPYVPYVPAQTYGTVSIFTTPSLARVYANGEFKGLSTITLTLDPGFYTIVVRLPGFQDHTMHVTLEAGMADMRTVVLRPS